MNTITIIGTSTNKQNALHLQIHEQIQSGIHPRDCLARLFSSGAGRPSQLPDGLAAATDNVSDAELWRIIATIIAEPPRRQPIATINSLAHVIQLLRRSRRILILTGAGVSVSCGIPDFRSRDGIYSRLRHEYPEMPDPQSMFDIRYFAQDPRPFYKFAREIYPGQFQPSASHRFIRALEQQSRLLRNYTQNIDTLERLAGIDNVIECHGSFATATCTRCRQKLYAIDIRDDILRQTIPMCRLCNPTAAAAVKADANAFHIDRVQPRNLMARGIMKPDIVFFGESLPDEFHDMIDRDKEQCDLLIVMGSSLKVCPVALIPCSLPPNVPQILINREQLENFGFDVELLGDSDVIVNQLCHM